MSLAVSFSSPATGTSGSLRSTTLLCKPPVVGCNFSLLHSKIRPAAIAVAAEKLQKKPPIMAAKAIQQSRDTAGSESESEPDPPAMEGSGGNTEAEITELGAEIKAAMEDRKSAAAGAREKRRDELLSGVAEEVKEIEWPAFQKVLGTTGVVLGVIAGSSVVLLTVNLILAEISDRVFAGQGVQDFFS